MADPSIEGHERYKGGGRTMAEEVPRKLPKLDFLKSCAKKI